MSGPLPAQVASAAQRMAHVAKARALVKAHQRAKPERESLPGRTWAAMDMRTRMVLVMLGSTHDGDPQQLARQPWGSFSEDDQLSMGVTARELSRGLRDSASLF